MNAMRGILAAIGVLRFLKMMTQFERELPVCARLFRWVFYFSLAGVCLSAFVIAMSVAGTFVASCFKAWGFL